MTGLPNRERPPPPRRILPALPALLLLLCVSSGAEAQQGQAARREAKARSVQAERLAGEGRIREAATLLEQAHQLDPDAGYLLRAGIMCEVSGDIECAYAAYLRVARSDGDWKRQAAARDRLGPLESRIQVEVVIDGPPGGTALNVDGVDHGTISGSKTVKVKPGRHVLELRKDGFLDLHAGFEARVGPPLRLDMQMKQKPGLLLVKVACPTGTVLVDGRSAGEIPLRDALELAAGQHSVRVQCQGFRESEALVAVLPDRMATYEPRLEVATPPPAPLPEPVTTQVEPVPAGRHSRYVPLAVGSTPFTTVRATHRAAMDLTWQVQDDSSGIAHMFGLGLDAEVAAVSRWLSLGTRIGMDVHSMTVAGHDNTDAAFREVEFGVKATPYDDEEGNVIAIVLKGGTGNAHASGFYTDWWSLGGGVMGQISLGSLRVLAVAGWGHKFPIADGLNAVDVVTWTVQPCFSVRGPHQAGMALVGSIPITGDSSGSLGYSHLVDALIGYVYSGNGPTGSLMVGVPITHRKERPDFGFFTRFGWEF